MYAPLFHDLALLLKELEVALRELGVQHRGAAAHGLCRKRCPPRHAPC
jgi:hypothetical protein